MKLEDATATSLTPSAEEAMDRQSAVGLPLDKSQLCPESVDKNIRPRFPSVVAMSFAPSADDAAEDQLFPAGPCAVQTPLSLVITDCPAFCAIFQPPAPRPDTR